MNLLSFGLVVAIVIVLDQATKAVVRTMAPGLGRFGTLIPGVIDLVHVENTGAAFSIGTGAGAVFVVLAAAVAVAAAVFVYRAEVPLSLACTLACVAGGGLGNMIDRIASGSVTDFLATVFMDFPVFNVADIFVTCGVAASFVLYLVWDNGGEDERLLVEE